MASAANGEVSGTASLDDVCSPLCTVLRCLLRDDWLPLASQNLSLPLLKQSKQMPIGVLLCPLFDRFAKGACVLLPPSPLGRLKMLRNWDSIIEIFMKKNYVEFCAKLNILAYSNFCIFTLLF